jgi:stress-induced-phosphoprotein 1
LKEQGNQAFKVGKFEEAIEFYTEGLKLAKTDQHVLYSNRSAAFAARNAFDKALEDAQKCIEVNPTWSKVCHHLTLF